MQTLVSPPRIWNPPTISVGAVLPTLERVDIFMSWLEELLLPELELLKSTARIGVEPAVAESPPIELQPANQLAEAAEEANAPLYAAASKMLPGKVTPAVKAGLVLLASL